MALQPEEQPAIIWQADAPFLKNAGFGDHSGYNRHASFPILNLDSLPGHRINAGHFPERTVAQKVAYSPLPEPAQLPWEAAIPGGLMMFGAASYVGGHFLRKSNNRYVHGAGVVLQGTGLTEFAMGTVACQPSRAAETAPAPGSEAYLLNQKVSILIELTQWKGYNFDGYTYLAQDGYISNPDYFFQQVDANTNDVLPNRVTLASMSTRNTNQEVKHQQFLVMLDAQGRARDAFYIHYLETPISAAGVFTPAELLDPLGNKVADITFNADLSKPDEPFATFRLGTPTAVPDATPPGTSYQIINLVFPSDISQEKKQNTLDAIMELTLTGNVLAAAEATLTVPSTPVGSETPAASATPSPTPTEAPTAISTPTEEVHPEAGPKPPGENVYFDDTTKEWAKPNPEDSNKPFHYKDIGLVQGWFKDIVVNPTYYGDSMPLIDEKGFGTAAGLHVWCEENLKCPSLQHLDTSDVVVNSGGVSFTRLLLPHIRKQAQKLHPEYSDWVTFKKDFDAGKISFPFTARGETHEYKIRPESSINIYIVKDMPDPDFNRASSKSKYGGDDQGNFNVAVYSPTAIESLSHEGFIDLLFIPTLPIFWTSDLSQESMGKIIIQQDLVNLGRLGINGDTPYFVITP